PKELVAELRQKAVERCEKSPDLYYSEDVERLKRDDWSVRRYLHQHKSKPDVQKGLEALDKALKWRKAYGVRELKDTDFAREGYTSVGAIIYGVDHNGTPIMIMRGKVSKKIKSWMKLAHQFLVYLVEKVDNSNEGKVNSSIIFKMQTVLEAVYKMCKSWLNEEQNKYVYLTGKKTITEYVDQDQLPDFLLGTNKTPYRTAPDGAPTAHELAEKLGIKPEKADKLVKHLEKFFEN
ncbi:unnamed protein product, partial [Oppiella nova]